MKNGSGSSEKRSGLSGSDGDDSPRRPSGREKAVVVAAYQPLDALPFWGRPAAIVPDDLIEEAGKEAAKTAAEGAELANSAGFDASSTAREEDTAWKAILGAAEEAGAGIIVLGSHGRGTVGSAVLGSVATTVAHHANLPVMICRPPDGE